MSRLLFSIAILAAAAYARAADIHLRAQAAVPGRAVHLADLAEIHGGSPDEARQLAQIELMAAPPQEQFITARQVREALLARGVDLRQHTISGASMIELKPGALKPGALKPGAEPIAASIFARPVGADDAAVDYPSDPAAAAIVRFLKSQVDAGLPWQVRVVRDEQGLGGVASSPLGVPAADAREIVVLQSRQRPERGRVRLWLGRQQFMVRWTTAGEPVEGLVTAEIKLPPTIVVAARDLPRGTLLHADDLQTKAAGEQDRRPGSLEFSEDAVGQETVRPFRAGHTIDAESIELPELVRRGERVSIIVNHGGVRVRAEGRARDSGRRGDTVTVESAARRNSFQAVVTGVNEVEVGVGAVVVARSPEAGERGERR